MPPPGRVKVLATGGVPPSTLNGETWYAGKSNIIANAKRPIDRGFLYQAQKLQKELDDRYGGDLKKMEAKYGFNPIFVQVLFLCPSLLFLRFWRA